MTFENQRAMALAIAKTQVRQGLSIRAAIAHTVDTLSAGTQVHPDLSRELRLELNTMFVSPGHGRVPTFNRRGVALLS